MFVPTPRMYLPGAHQILFYLSMIPFSGFKMTFTMFFHILLSKYVRTQIHTSSEWYFCAVSSTINLSGPSFNFTFTCLPTNTNVNSL